MIPMKYQTYILFGAPGSGKGTQGRTLGTHPALFSLRLRRCLSLDRYAHESRPRLSRIFQQGPARAGRDHGRTLEGAIDAAVDAHKFKPDIDILVLDGIPRNVGQAKIMDELIDVQKVFHLSCPNREALFARLKKRALRTIASTTRTRK